MQDPKFPSQSSLAREIISLLFFVLREGGGDDSSQDRSRNMIRVDESDPVGGKKMKKRDRISVAEGFRGFGSQVSQCFSKKSVEENAESAFCEDTKSARTSRMAGNHSANDNLGNIYVRSIHQSRP